MNLGKLVYRCASLIALTVVFFAMSSIFSLAPLANAQLNTAPQTTASSLPTYNAGVDKQLESFLCAPQGNGTDLINCVNRIYRFSISAGAIFLVLMIVIAGYQYMIGGESGKKSAKNILFGSVVGMAIILGTYALLNTLNPNLTNIKVIQPPIFSSANLPKCEDVGFATDCVSSTGQVVTAPTGGGAPTGGATGPRCSPLTSGVASVSALQNTCFRNVAEQASGIAHAESGGQPALPVSSAFRCADGSIPVWGLYQINITVHKIGNLDCKKAFSSAFTGSNRSCRVVNQDLYNQCVAAVKDPIQNINAACAIYRAAGNKWSPWEANTKWCKFPGGPL